MEGTMDKLGKVRGEGKLVMVRFTIYGYDKDFDMLNVCCNPLIVIF